MAHMSPRLKARRGRFGLGGLRGAVLLILSPANGSIFGPGSPATLPNFVGSAADDLDGDISANISWHVQGIGSPAAGLPLGSPDTGDATGASVDLSGFFATGSPVTGSPKADKVHTVVATVVDAGGNRSTVSISITIAAS